MENGMPIVKWGLPVVLAAALTVSQALADGVLAPGKPAGTREAVRHSPNIYLISGAALVAVVGIAIALDHSSSAACGSACDGSTLGTAA
jgi:hypothetical protein